MDFRLASRLLRPLVAALCLVGLAAAAPAEGPAPNWPCFHGPHGNFSAAETGVAIVDDLHDARLLWKSEAATPPGAAQSPRYGGHAFHGISLGKFQPVKIPLARGGDVTSGGGIPLPGGGAGSLVVDAGRVFCWFFSPTGDVVDATETAKRSAGPWTPDYWKVDADDVVLAVDAETGKTLWKKVFASKGMNWCDHKSIITNHSPCVFGGRVYAIGSTCRVYCLDAAKGDVVWEGDLGAEHQRLESVKKEGLAKRKVYGGVNRGHCNGTAFAGGTLVCPDFKNGLIGLDGATGRKLWQIADALDHHSTPTRWVSPAGEFILSGSNKGAIRCIEPGGKIRWQIEAGVCESTISVAQVGGEHYMLLNMGKDPIGMGDEKLVGRASGWRIAPDAAAKLWEHTGAEKVGFTGGGLTGTPVWNGKAMIRTKSGLSLVDVVTGKVLARCADLQVSQESHAYAAEGKFFHEPDSQHGKIHGVVALGAAAETFKPLGKAWETPHYDATGYEMPISHPVVAGRLYLRGADGIYCWDLRKGRP
jgi:outer membrane protein assembly factor BamB